MNWIELNDYIYVDIVIPVFQNKLFSNLKFLDNFDFKITSTFQNIKPCVPLCYFSYLFVSINCFSSYWYSNKYSRAGKCLQWFTRRSYNRRHSPAAIPKRQAIILRLCVFLLSDTHSPTEILMKFQVVFCWRNSWNIFVILFSVINPTNITARSINCIFTFRRFLVRETDCSALFFKLISALFHLQFYDIRMGQ
jgi:hypothetical protein